jgi:hypothetical protein
MAACRNEYFSGRNIWMQLLQQRPIQQKHFKHCKPRYVGESSKKLNLQIQHLHVVHFTLADKLSIFIE